MIQVQRRASFDFIQRSSHGRFLRNRAAKEQPTTSRL
jgi:hypothetical protein